MAEAGAAAGAIVVTTLLEVLIFLGDKETMEYGGRKHIKAADLLREIARRRAANPAWNNKAAIGHCVRSFRNYVAVWWEETILSDNGPMRVKAIVTSWKEFEVVFRLVWKIKSTMMSVAWMDKNRQKSNESIAAFVTRVQNAVATTTREALTNTANDIKEEYTPMWADRREKRIAAQAIIDGGRVNQMTAVEKATLLKAYREFGQESQQAMR
jgi:hypothetical protein